MPRRAGIGLHSTTLDPLRPGVPSGRICFVNPSAASYSTDLGMLLAIARTDRQADARSRGQQSGAAFARAAPYASLYTAQPAIAAKIVSTSPQTTANSAQLQGIMSKTAQPIRGNR